jgi:hypothetical protein
VNVGDIFRVHTTLANPPKQKIVLYVGRLGDIDLFLWFNTEARRNRPAQMQVKPGQAPGISRDCFLDCSRVTTFPQRELEDAVLCGRVNREFLLGVAQEIEARALTLTNAQRKAVAASIKERLHSLDIPL